jgi:hypothetical protein
MTTTVTTIAKATGGGTDAAVRGVLAFATAGGFGWALGACYRGLLYLFWAWLLSGASFKRSALGWRVAIWIWRHLTRDSFRRKIAARLGLNAEHSSRPGMLGGLWVRRLELALGDDPLKTRDSAKGLALGGLVGIPVMLAYALNLI